MISSEKNQRLLSICTKKIEKNPYNIKALLLRASINIKLNSLSQAENDIYQIINQNPNSSIAYYLLGIISQQKKNYQQSLFYLTKSLELEPNNINALYTRAAVYNELNFYKKAIDDYNLALQIDSQNNNQKRNIYKNIADIVGTLTNDEQEEEKVNNYNDKSDMELSAEINNYMYEQLKALSLQNKNKEHKQYEFNDSDNKINKNKEKDNEVKEIYDPNEEKDENEFLFGKRNTNIDNIIKNNNKLKQDDTKEKNLNEVNINNLGTKEDLNNANKSQSRYHNDGHTTHDMNINEVNIMISKEEENENILNHYNKNNMNYLNNNDQINLNKNDNDNDNENILNEEQKKVSQSQQQLNNYIQYPNNSLINNIPNKKYEKWEIYHNQGYSARKKDNFKLAIELYTKAINLNPKYFKAYFNRGFAYDKISQYDNAINDYTKDYGYKIITD